MNCPLIIQLKRKTTLPKIMRKNANRIPSKEIPTEFHLETAYNEFCWCYIISNGIFTNIWHTKDCVWHSENLKKTSILYRIFWRNSNWWDFFTVFTFLFSYILLVVVVPSESKSRKLKKKPIYIDEFKKKLQQHLELYFASQQKYQFEWKLMSFLSIWSIPFWN